MPWEFVSIWSDYFEWNAILTAGFVAVDGVARELGVGWGFGVGHDDNVVSIGTQISTMAVVNDQTREQWKSLACEEVLYYRESCLHVHVNECGLPTRDHIFFSLREVHAKCEMPQKRKSQ